MKIRPVEADLFHADGQTDTAKLIVSFRYSSKGPNDALETALNEICTDAYLFDLFHTKTGFIKCVMAFDSMKVQCFRAG